MEPITMIFLLLVSAAFVSGTAVYSRASKNVKAGKGGRTRKGRREVTARDFARAAVELARENTPSARRARRLARARKKFEEAKARGETARTARARRNGEFAEFTERRGWREVFGDVREGFREIFGPPPAGPADPAPADDPAKWGHPLTGTGNCPKCGRERKATIPAGEENIVVTCICGHKLDFRRMPPGGPPDEEIHPKADPAPEAKEEARADEPAEPTKNEEARDPMPTYTKLFEAADALAAAPFEHLFEIEGFMVAFRDRLPGVATMYADLAERMSSKMSIDPIVTNPVAECATHQNQIHAQVSEACAALVKIFSASPAELLECGIKVPPPELLNGEGSHAAGALLVPVFYEEAQALANRPMTDLRDLNALLKALHEASVSQSAVYTAIGAKLSDKGIDRIVYEPFFVAARIQNTIGVLLADADGHLTRLINMTVRELAAASIIAPRADLANV